MMRLAPLQLKLYHFSGLSVLARPSDEVTIETNEDEFFPGMQDAGFSTNVELMEPEEANPHEFFVALTVSCNPSSESKFPYIIAAKIEGLFSINHDGDIDERKSLVVCNGASMLYGAVREQLISLTSRHKYGPVLLPSVSFNGMIPAKPLKTKGTRKVKAKSPGL